MPGAQSKRDLGSSFPACIVFDPFPFSSFPAHKTRIATAYPRPHSNRLPQPDTFLARMEELQPAVSGAHRMRVDRFAQRVVAELLAQLKSQAEAAGSCPATPADFLG
jgi:hypothetical protein